MKKYLLGLFAIALAIGFSAFSSPKKSSFGVEYLIYNGSGDEDDFANWSQLSAGTPDACTYSIPEPCWLKVTAAGETVTQGEFETAFEAIDEGASPGDGFISDESPDDVVFSLRDDE